MPGIAGIMGPGRPMESGEGLRQMVQSMMHEPFYSKGTYVHEPMGIWLGWINHAGSFADGMPIWNEKHDVCAIISGEDFSDPDELRRLRARGHDFALGDASYLVHLYEEHGSEFIEKLNGQFCGMVIDLRSHMAVLFNDRYGLNRIYYHERGDKIYFASEAKSLLRVLPDLRQSDPRCLGEFLSCGCVLQGRTLFPGISLIPGGSAWSYSGGKPVLKNSYFRPKDWEEQEPLAAGEYYDRLKEAWTRVLPRYLQGPQQAALSLTGGKDSRMILAWAGSRPASLPCYTFGGPYRDCEDVRLARLAAEICGQSHHVIPIGKEFFPEFPNLAEKAIYLSDGTMDVTGATELFVNRLAREIAPVRLTGNYAQEMLRSSVAFGPVPLSKGILQEEFQPFIREASETYHEEIRGRALSFVAFKQVPWYHYARLAIERSQLTLRSPFLDNDIVSICFRVPAELSQDIEIQLRIIAEGNPALARIETDRSVLLEPIPVLTRIKHIYKEFTFKAEYAYDYGMPQWLAKIDSVLRRLHLERLFLGKHKFAHFRIWYRDELSSYVKEILLDPRSRSRPYLNGPRLERMVIDHANGIRNYTAEIHQLLTCELIHRRFLD